jgi:hypothetical protein
MPPVTPSGTLLAGIATTLHLLGVTEMPRNKRKIGCWEMAVRIKKITCAVLDEAHKRRVEETNLES